MKTRAELAHEYLTALLSSSSETDGPNADVGMAFALADAFLAACGPRTDAPPAPAEGDAVRAWVTRDGDTGIPWLFLNTKPELLDQKWISSNGSTLECGPAWLAERYLGDAKGPEAIVEIEIRRVKP